MCTFILVLLATARVYLPYHHALLLISTADLCVLIESNKFIVYLLSSLSNFGVCEAVSLSFAHCKKANAYVTYVALHAAYRSCSGVFCVTERAGVQPIGCAVQAQAVKRWTDDHKTVCLCAPVCKTELHWRRLRCFCR